MLTAIAAPDFGPAGAMWNTAASSSTRRLLPESITHRVRRIIEPARNAWATVNDRPVFVLGNPKSGTTAIAACLARRAGLSLTLDIPALFGRTISSVRNGDQLLADLVRKQRTAFSRDIIKQPSLTFIYPELCEQFPEARYVLVVRDPRANVRSILDRLGIVGTLDDLRPAEASSVPTDWLASFDAPAMGLPDGTYIETLSRRWCLAADLHLTGQGSFAVIRYEDFVSNAEPAIDALCSALRLEPRHELGSIMNRQYQSAGGNRDRPWKEFFGHENLARIEHICGRRMTKLGYRTVVE